MGMTCQIFVEKPTEGVHKPGQSVVGVVKYKTNEETEFKDIVLKFYGEGQSSWREGNPTPDDSYDYTDYKGTENYISREIHFLNKIGKAIPPGTYKYPFKFVLPNNIPSSYKDTNCTISYCIEVTFKKTNFFSLNKTFRVEVPVYGYVEPKTEPFEAEKVLTKPFSSRKQRVNLKCVLTNPLISPGESAYLFFTVTNDSDVTIKSVKTQLYEHTEYISDCGRTKGTIRNISECFAETPSVPRNGVANMSSVFPTLSELYTIQNSRVMRREYKLMITVRLPLPHRNMIAEMPIAIGQRRYDVEMALDALTLVDEVGQSQAHISEFKSPIDF